LDKAGARPVSDGPYAALFVLSGHRWPQFYPGGAGDRIVVQRYNPAGQVFSEDADASLAAAARTWTAVPASSFVLALGGRTSAVDGLDGVNVIDWPPTTALPPEALAITVVYFATSTGDILEADLLIKPGAPFALEPQPGDGTYDFQRVILHEDG